MARVFERAEELPLQGDFSNHALRKPIGVVS